MSSAKNTKNRSMGRERREGSNLGEWNPILEEREKCFGAHTFEKDTLFGYSRLPELRLDLGVSPIETTQISFNFESSIPIFCQVV